MIRKVNPVNPPESHEMKCLALYLNAHPQIGPYGWAKYVGERILRHGDYAYYKSLLAQGLKPGHPDVVIYSSPTAASCRAPAALMFKGAAIELKRRKGGKSTALQDLWLSEFAKRGYLVCVAHGFGEAREFLKKYYRY